MSLLNYEENLLSRHGLPLASIKTANKIDIAGKNRGAKITNIDDTIRTCKAYKLIYLMLTAFSPEKLLLTTGQQAGKLLQKTALYRSMVCGALQTTGAENRLQDCFVPFWTLPQ